MECSDKIVIDSTFTHRQYRKGVVHDKKALFKLFLRPVHDPHGNHQNHHPCGDPAKGKHG